MNNHLYVARWPDGTATVFTAESLGHAVDLIDEIGNPQECEVVPFDAGLWLTFKPSEDLTQGLLTLCRRPTVEIDSQSAIVAIAYPVLAKLIDDAEREAEDDDIDDVIDGDRWSDAASIEVERILAPSSEWREAFEAWWDALGPNNSTT